MAGTFKKICWFAFLFLAGCANPTEQPEAPEPVDTLTTVTTVDSLGNVVTSSDPGVPDDPYHNCTLRRKTLEGNELWLKDQGILVTVTADSGTYDKALKTDSYRILEAYKTDHCSQIFRQVLPVNKSPDFAYYVDKRNFEKRSQRIIIRGFDRLYVYDIKNNRLLPTLKPAFHPGKQASDSQSGAINDIGLWQQYIVGYATDMGGFVFDLRNPAKPAAPLPVKEFVSKETGEIRDLFLLETTAGLYQAVVPIYEFENAESSGLIIKTLFDKPRPILRDKLNATQDNRFVLLQEKDPSGKLQYIAVNLEHSRLADLPANAAEMTVHDLLKILKGS